MSKGSGNTRSSSSSSPRGASAPQIKSSPSSVHMSKEMVISSAKEIYKSLGYYYKYKFFEVNVVGDNLIMAGVSHRAILDNDLQRSVSSLGFEFDRYIRDNRDSDDYTLFFKRVKNR